MLAHPTADAEERAVVVILRGTGRPVDGALDEVGECARDEVVAGYDSAMRLLLRRR